MPASSAASRAPSRESRVSALPGHPSRTTSGTVECVFHGFLPPNPWEGSGSWPLYVMIGSPSERLQCGALFSDSMTILVFSNTSVALSPLTSGRTPRITLDDLCAHLLPPDDHIQFQSLIIDEPHLILVAAMLSPHSTCPDCRHPTHRIHGHSRRTLADLPWATAPIELP